MRRDREESERQEMVMRTFDAFCSSHPSFAHVFWRQESVRLGGIHGDVVATELKQRIDKAVEQYSARDKAIEGVLQQCADRRGVSAVSFDAEVRLEEMQLLQEAIRNHEIDLEELAFKIDQMANSSDLSNFYREELGRHAEELRIPLLAEVHAVPLHERSEVDDAFAQHTGGDAGHHAPVLPTLIVERIAGKDAVDVDDNEDQDRLVEAQQEDITPEVRDREYALAQEKILRKLMSDWRVLAEREIVMHGDLPWLVDILAGLEEEQRDLLSDLHDCRNELPSVDLRVDRYVAMQSDVLMPIVAADIVRVNRILQEKHDDYVGDTFIPLAREILRVQVRCEVYRDHILQLHKALRKQAIQHSPHTLLHVAPDADRATIERAYVAAVNMFDFDSAHDREEMGDLQRARDVLLYSIELREIHEAAMRRAEEQRQPLMQETRFSQKGMEKARALQQEPPSLFEKIVCGPGGFVRAAFGALILALGGGGVLAHETQNADAYVRESAGESDDGHADDGALDGGVDDGADEGVEAAPSGVAHTVVSSETMWGIAGDMLRARGLKATDTLTGYFTHVVWDDNKVLVPVPEKMQPGTILDLTRAAQEMDAMVAAASSSTSEQATSVDAPSSDAASIFERGDEGALGSDIGSTIARTDDVASGSDAALPDASWGVSAEHVRETIRVMKKGDRIYTMVYGLLKEKKFKWSSERVRLLTQIVLNDNADNFRTMVADGRMRAMKDVWLPVGAEIDMTRAMQVIDEMATARDTGKKVKSVKQIAKEQGIPYPIQVKFPS